MSKRPGQTNTAPADLPELRGLSVAELAELARNSMRDGAKSVPGPRSEADPQEVTLATLESIRVTRARLDSIGRALIEGPAPETGVSLSACARALGVSMATVSRWRAALSAALRTEA